MKCLFLLLCIAVAANAAALNLGTEKCSYGPTYWCGTIDQANECGAVQYCLDNHWHAISTKESSFCTDCEDGIALLRRELEKASTEDAILKILEKFCTDLGTLSEDCKLLVKTYGAQVLKSLIEELQPDQVCALMGFCESDTTSVADDIKQNIPAKLFELLIRRGLTKVTKMVISALPGDKKTCSDCTKFFNDLKNLLNTPSVETEITNEVKKLCNYLGAYKTECELIVTTLVPQGIGELVEKMDAKVICTDIQFCGESEDMEPQPEPPADDPCTDCKDFMGDVQTLLNSASFQKMILQELDTVCDDLGSLSAQCKSYVNEYGPVVLPLIISQFSPDQVCQLITFCSGNDVHLTDLLLASTQQLTSSNDICADCTAFFQDVSTILNNATVQQTILEDIEKLCDDLGSFGPQCKQYVSEYGPLVINVLLQYLDPKAICSEIGFCMSEQDPVPVAEPGDTCSDCKAFISDMDDLLKNYTIQEKILTDLEVLCKYVPNYTEQCKKYVVQYGALVFEVIAGLINPPVICTDVGFCSGEKSLWSKIPVTLIRSFAPNDMCSDCTAFFQDIVNLLNNATVQNMIIQDLEMLCSDLGTFGPQCKQYVDEYGPLVINLLLQYVDPNAICTEIQFCSDSSVPPANVNQNTDMCTDCTAFMTDVSTYLSTPSVQQMILRDIAKICDDLGTIGPQCQQYVQEYGPLVFSFILNYFDPSTICSEIGFCSGNSAFRTFMTMALKQALNADQCTDCKNFFQDVSTDLNNPAVQQMILKDIANLCNDLGTIGPQCQQYVEEYGPLVINFLLQYLDPNAICLDIGFCSSVSAKAFQLNADQCTDCKNFFQDVSTDLNKPAVQQMILKDLANLCNDLGSIGPQCQQYVQEYGPLVFNLLLQYLDPNALCGDIGFCSSTVRTSAKHFQVNADQCTDCKNFFQDVSTDLNNPAVQQMILKDIANFCNELGTIGPQCQQYVEEYGPLVINFLLQYLDPNAICSEIGFCSSTIRISSKPFQLNADQCTDCKNFFQDLSTDLNNPAVQQMILKDIANLCNDLGTIGPQCQQYVQEYGPLVLNFLLQYLDPISICSGIGFCVASEAPIPVKVAHSPVGCEICEYILHELDVVLDDGKTEEEITNALKKVCSLLPATLSDQCSAFVTQYGPVILQLIANEIDPEKICTLITLCKSEKVSLAQLDQSTECVLCEYAMNTLDKILEKHSTQEDIEKALSLVCILMPASLKDECEQFISQYTPAIIEILLQDISPSSVCRLIGLCTSETPELEHIVGGPLCIVCEYILKELDKLLVKPATVSDIEAALDKVCSLLPGTLSEQCEEFVNTYTPRIVQLLTQGIPPGLVCKILGLCILSEEPLQAEPQIEVAGDEEAGEFCAICEFAMSEIDKILQEPATEAEIEAALNKVCSLLPKTVSDTCKSFVAEYTREIIYLISQSVSPKQVCTILGLCSNSEPEKIKEAKVDDLEVSASTECIVCEYVIRRIETELDKTSTQAEVQALLDKVCTLLPATLAEDCNMFVNYYTSEFIFEFLKKYPANKLCILLKVCIASPEAELKEVTHLETVKASPSCAICEFAIKELENMLQKNATEGQIRKALNGLCDVLPKTVAEDCQSFVDYYTEEIIFILVSQFPPDTLCRTLHLCAQSEETVEELSPKAPVTSDVDGTTCALCEFVMKKLDTMLAKKATQQEIEEALEKVCSLLPKTLSDECKQFVDQYTPTIIQLLLSEISPQQVCSLLGLCSSSEAKQNEIAIGIEATPTCAICEFAVKELESMLQKNSTEAEIRKALNGLCAMLPKTVAEDCISFVDYYTEEIVFILVSQFPPETLCRTLQLCEQSEETLEELDTQAKKTPSVMAGPTCAVCEFVMEKLESILAKNATQEEIERALEKVCSLLPSTIRDECSQFVVQYTPMIIQLIISSVPPSELCSAIGLCSAENDFQAKVSCDFCIFIIRDLELFITKNSTEQEIDKILSSACKAFPGTLKEQCISFIKMFGNAIPELIVTFVNPQKVCQAVNLCSSTEVSKYSLVQRCKIGPSFWCATQANADLCNAVEHCKRHVWN